MYGYLPGRSYANDPVLLIDGKVQENSRGFGNSRQSELYTDLVTAFEEHDPLFKYEYFYIESIFEKSGQLEKEKPMDSGTNLSMEWIHPNLRPHSDQSYLWI